MIHAAPEPIFSIIKVAPNVPRFVSVMPLATVNICTNCAGEAVYKAP
jgi:hypothetical protein